MTQSSLIITGGMLAIAIFAAGNSVHSQEAESPSKLILHPAAEPGPALKYRLLPTYLERTPGNAAVFYGKVTAEQIGFFSNNEVQENFTRWERTPLDQLEIEKVEPTGSIVQFLDQAARCDQCDWQLPIRQSRYYELLLPEVQQTRQFARILAVHARVHIARGEFDDALHDLQTGYALARNVGAGQTLVNGLVACSIVYNHIHPQVTDFIQQPNAPNLYWALSMLPNPLIDFGDALDVEAHALDLMYPEFRDLENAIHSPDEWRALFHRTASELNELTDSRNADRPPTAEDLDKICSQRFNAGKQELISRGMSPEKVGSMNQYQIMLLHALHAVPDQVEQGVKYFHSPYPQSIDGINAAIKRAEVEQEPIPVGLRTLRAVRAARNAVARNERQVAFLRLVEALRMHAANHQGELPASLNEITVVPVPDDPANDAPFIYRVDGEKALVSGPALPDAPFLWEITIARP